MSPSSETREPRKRESAEDRLVVAHQGGLGAGEGVEPMERGDGLEWLGAVVETFGPIRLSLYDDPSDGMSMELEEFTSSAGDFELED